MTFGEKLKAARMESGLKQSELAKQLNTTGNTISNWENNVSKPDLDTLSYICGILHVTASYFLQATIPEDEVSLPELKLVKKFRNLDQHGQKTVIYILDQETARMSELNTKNERIAELEKETSQNNINNTKLRLINYYYRLASAGTGQIVFDMPPTEKIEIPDIPEYRKVDYAIGVNGNSMEPEYQDGDILLIEMTEKIEVGEVGIFIADNESYVKKMGNRELISLNPKYSNIPLTEDSKCMGKVVDKL